MSSVEKILWMVTILLFLGGFGYALYNTSRTGSEAEAEAPTTLEPSIPAGWTRYVDVRGFTIERPAGYYAQQDHVYELGEGSITKGVAFMIPATYATGTNLSSDSYLSIEQLNFSATSSCNATAFLTSTRASTTTVTEDGVRYSFAEITGAAAGNRYEEQVYALSEGRPCTAVRYFIHSTNSANYDPGTIQEFNRDDLIAEFDEIRRTLKIN